MYDIDTDDYATRVYAGVLGKIIGVYLGRPIEGMLYRDIKTQLGCIDYYVHEQRKRELIVADDDLSGTFTFIRALEDFPGAKAGLTAEQIGQTWLNYIIENKSILWWGGIGLSTEHTAFLRLKSGVPAPMSGSIALNSKVVAEQIGSQIFIDGWAMVAPGDPQLAADFARKAASVSHDGEAIYGAQVIALMESLAFVEPSLHRLLDSAVEMIPDDSITFRMIAELRQFHAAHPGDWERAMVEVLEKSYGYDKYGGNCHIIPNHGVIILALLYGEDNFQRSLMIANTCGWDTDCNAGNVGCLLGIKNGLAGIDSGPDWRGPVADRLYLPTADGGECVTDALTQAYRLINLGRSLQDKPPLKPKAGARFHFSLPASVQGFHEDTATDSRGAAVIASRGGKLEIKFQKLARGRVARVAVETFALSPTEGSAYALSSTPTLASGQTVSALVEVLTADAAVVRARLYVECSPASDSSARVLGPQVLLSVTPQLLKWVVPPTDGPIFKVGIEIAGENGASGVASIDWLTWTGTPNLLLGALPARNEMWRQTWIQALDTFVHTAGTNAFMAVNNRGRGMALHGTRQWEDYSVTAILTPHLAKTAGIAARVHGLMRYYALMLVHPSRVMLVKMSGQQQTLGEADFPWRWNDDPHELTLALRGNRISASIDGKILFAVEDTESPLTCGGIALIIEEGRMASSAVHIQPLR